MYTRVCIAWEGYAHKRVYSFVWSYLQVDFWVTLQVTQCLPEPHLLRLLALGFSEELTVELHTLCDCNCSDVQPRAPYCSDGQGDLQCGICR